MNGKRAREIRKRLDKIRREAPEVWQRMNYRRIKRRSVHPPLPDDSEEVKAMIRKKRDRLNEQSKRALK
jgi:hypothetical protein